MPRHRRNITTSSKPTMRARSAHAQARKKFVQYDTTPIRPKKSKAPKIIAITVIVLIVILIALFLIIPNVFAQSNEGSLPATTSATVVIESGDTARDVAKKFESMNLVANADKFVEELERSGALKSLIPGSYTFKGQTDTKHITQRLKTGDSDDSPTITVVEGYTLKATASAIDDASSSQISYDDFINATSDASKYASDYDFLKEVGTNSLEGFLLPKTYDIGTSDTAETMVKKMLDQFKTEAMALDYSYPKKNNLSVYDAVKLASVVEKESSGDIQPRVAGIFYNRLRSDSPYLQSDATTAYSVGHNPTGEEVHADDPYSTYTNPGLPPTPICNPSIDALESVCNPEENNYRYFYSYDDGTYAFSETYEEHQAAIAKDTQQ